MIGSVDRFPTTIPSLCLVQVKLFPGPPSEEHWKVALPPGRPSEEPGLAITVSLGETVLYIQVLNVVIVDDH